LVEPEPVELSMYIRPNRQRKSARPGLFFDSGTYDTVLFYQLIKRVIG
jgi:hypothetical protein